MPLSSLTLIRQYIVTESYAQTLLRKSNRDAGSPLLRNNPAIKALAVAPPRRNRDQHHRLSLSSNRCGKVVVEMNERHTTMLTVCRRMSTKHPTCLKKAVTRHATNARYHVSMNTAQKAPANNSLLRAVINPRPKNRCSGKSLYIGDGVPPGELRAVVSARCACRLRVADRVGRRRGRAHSVVGDSPP